MRQELAAFLCGLRLRMHPRKSRVYRTREGVTFLGWRVFPDRLRLVRPAVVRWRRAIRAMQREFSRGTIAASKITERVRAWIAHAEHGDTWELRGQLQGAYSFSRQGAGPG